MIEVIRERQVQAPPARIWPLVDDPERLPSWLGFAERMEVLAGSGAGRRQRLHGRWGGKRSEIDQVVTAYEPERLLAWRHEAERLDGRPAPRFARSTEFSIRLEPTGDATVVRLRSCQEPASMLRGVVMRAFGQRELAGQMNRALERLAKLATA